MFLVIRFFDLDHSAKFFILLSWHYVYIDKRKIVLIPKRSIF